jgi:hypothetical protein
MSLEGMAATEDIAAMEQYFKADENGGERQIGRADAWNCRLIEIDALPRRTQSYQGMLSTHKIELAGLPSSQQ